MAQRGLTHSSYVVLLKFNFVHRHTRSLRITENSATPTTSRKNNHLIKLTKKARCERGQKKELKFFFSRSSLLLFFCLLRNQIEQHIHIHQSAFLPCASKTSRWGPMSCSKLHACSILFQSQLKLSFYFPILVKRE